MVGTADSVLIREVSFIQSALYREVSLYMQLFSQPLPSMCQVGLSFLGGVAIAVLLIPVNRWLAKKIGKLTDDMMAHKDSRVKVRGAAAGTPSLSSFCLTATFTYCCAYAELSLSPVYLWFVCGLTYVCASVADHH